MSRDEITEADIPIRHITADEVRAASVTVCRYATDARDAGELLAMLGLAAEGSRFARPCRLCDRPMSTVDCVGHTRPGHDGLCARCVEAVES
ncbi:hypothetical protein ACWESM_18730 [Nocardia sp. NPDC003999]